MCMLNSQHDDVSVKLKAYALYYAVHIAEARLPRISKEALFKGVRTKFGLRTTEKLVENPDL